VNAFNIAACGCFTLGCVLLGATTQPGSGTVVQAKAGRQFQGTVSEVWVTSPGNLEFRVAGTDEKGKSAHLWFKSPRDKDINTLLENLALSIVRHSLQDGVDLILDFKDSSTDDGSLPEKSIGFVRMGMRPRAGSAPR
jgi:hypothetical protein